MGYKAIIFISILSVLLGCSKKSEKYVLKITPVQFTVDDMYDKDKIYDFVFDNEENNTDSLKKLSRIAFLQAIDLYKNKNRPHLAIPKFVESIMIFPDGKTYVELGNAYFDIENYDNAVKAYDVAIEIDVQPGPNLYFNKLIAEFRENKKDPATEIDDFTWKFRDVFNNGFSDTTRLKALPEFKLFIKDNTFRNLYTSYLIHKDSSNQNSVIKIFTSNFPDRSGGYEIPLDKVSAYDSKSSISYDFAQFIPEMENTEFGREVSHDFYYLAKVAETANYIALLYSSVNFSDQDMQPVQTMIATLDNQGNVVSRKLFACQCTPEKVKTGKIENGEITLTDYRRTWEKKITEVPFEKNKIIGNELISSTTYKIDEYGKIIESNKNDVPKDAVVKEATNATSN